MLVIEALTAHVLRYATYSVGLFVLESHTIAAVVGKEKLVLFLAWRLLSVLICLEG